MWCIGTQLFSRARKEETTEAEILLSDKRSSASPPSRQMFVRSQVCRLPPLPDTDALAGLWLLVGARGQWFEDHHDDHEPGKGMKLREEMRVLQEAIFQNSRRSASGTSAHIERMGDEGRSPFVSLSLSLSSRASVASVVSDTVV